ncbi:non-specific lipid transfer protein GPI-anchored 5 [Beta vulgaris subsp. vulgaris]|uniref:non-specific lipid transfer protein GPI-anchored 5 n=1 Tax=Beta vulgaris subsp. vulgaris TaxID=3555 RepID=UPI0020370C15|nr:non-specific lipid transfer protein GPI-anchored 5 [Beta vulgaris subsp. vulgaris]
MASRGSQVWLVLLLLAIALTWGGAKAQSSSNSCTSVLLSMSSCLNFITGNSSAPASSCCSALSNVVQSQPQCLCSALSSGAASSLGVAINQTRALGLPNACNVQTPPTSQCNGSGGPSTSGAAPSDSPAGVPDDEPQGPAADFPSGSGSKTVPSTDESNGSTMKSSFHMLAFIFSVVSCTSALAIF